MMWFMMRVIRMNNSFSVLRCLWLLRCRLLLLRGRLLLLLWLLLCWWFAGLFCVHVSFVVEWDSIHLLSEEDL